MVLLAPADSGGLPGVFWSASCITIPASGPSTLSICMPSKKLDTKLSLGLPSLPFDVRTTFVELVLGSNLAVMFLGVIGGGCLVRLINGVAEDGVMWSWKFS